MKSSRKSRKSICYSIFIGVLAGSVFSGSSAIADVYTLSSISTMVADGEVTLIAGATYTAGLPTDEGFLVADGSAYFDNFSGTFAGNGATITGLTVPLFNDLGGEVSELVLRTDSGGVSGNGVLANRVNMYTTIDEVQASGVVNGVSDYVGGLVGLAGWDSTISNSSFTGTVAAENNENYVGGLVGISSGSITGSNTSGGTIESTGSYVGGLVGSSSGQISDSTSSMVVTSSGNYVGGLIGYTTGAVIDSSASGNVSSSGFGVVGGLIGYADGNSADPVSITLSHATGAVDGSTQIGGLIGLTSGTVTISDSYARGSTEGDTEVGGLVGYAGVISGNTAISDSYATGAVVGNGNYIGGLVGYMTLGDITNSYATGDVVHNSNGQAIGGLIGYSISSISNSYAAGDVTVGAGGGWVGGLVGENAGSIEYSYASGNVSSGSDVGGLVGYTAGGFINNSYATGNVTSSNASVGGLVGQNDGTPITHSYAGGSVTGIHEVGGLIGNATGGDVSSSYARISGSVTGETYVGGLIGFSSVYINNSFAEVSESVVGDLYVGGLVGYAVGNIDNSYARADVDGGNSVGGLVGYLPNGGGSVYNSYATGQISADFDDGYGYAVGGLVGAGCTGCEISQSYATGTVLIPDDFGDLLVGTPYATVINSCGGEIDAADNFSCMDEREVSDEFNYRTVGLSSPAGVLGAAFTTNACLNNGNPYLVSLFNSYESSCGDGDNETPSRRERVVREVMETRTPEKIEKTLGFKNDTPLPRDAVIAFLQSTDKIDIAKVKSFEITPNAIVRVSTKTEEALQISLKSESKAPVELWVLSPDGKWLLAGVITFDKDGKAILPPLQFKNAGDYSLVFSTPSADSAKASAPLNLSGQVLVSVS
jgi:hypothetical protein